MSIYSVRAAKVSHGREYKTVVTFALSDFAVSADSWLGIVLQHAEARSGVSPFNTSDIERFKRLLEKLAADKDLQSILLKHPSFVGRKEMQTLFQGMEDCIEKHFSWSPAIRARASMDFRRYMAELSPPDSFREPLQRHFAVFRTRYTFAYAPRPILGSNIEDGECIDPPIDALPHEDIRDLKEKIKRKLDREVTKLIDACVSELQHWSRVRAALHAAASSPCLQVELAAAYSFLVHGIGAIATRKAAMSVPSERILPALAKLATGSQVGEWRIASSRCRGRSELTRALLNELGVKAEDSKPVPDLQILQMTRRAHARELSAAFILLLVHTGWNASSLRQMPIRAITSSGNAYVIQGFKKKTGRFTPEVLLDSTHRGALDAIDLIIWNHRRLRDLGLIGPDDHDAWHVWPKDHESKGPQTLGDISRFVSQFAAQYALPRFSLDQIRTHMLFRLAVRKGSIEAARAAAGHSSLDTTANYLDQFYREILNKSINLEFQRRLEQRIRREAFAKGDLSTTSVLLRKPVGDGTSCIDPSSPPKHEWTESGLCSAKFCHTGEGCPNNRIEISKERLEEVVRWNQYYKKNWQRLYEENPVAFARVHGPSMIMNFALLTYLLKSVYREHVRLMVDKTTS